MSFTGRFARGLLPCLLPGFQKRHAAGFTDTVMALFSVEKMFFFRVGTGACLPERSNSMDGKDGLHPSSLVTAGFSYFRQLEPVLSCGSVGLSGRWSRSARRHKHLQSCESDLQTARFNKRESLYRIGTYQKVLICLRTAPTTGSFRTCAHSDTTGKESGEKTCSADKNPLRG
jgi:hypothetical protein